MPGRHNATRMEEVPVSLIQVKKSFAADIMQIYDASLQAKLRVSKG